MHHHDHFIWSLTHKHDHTLWINLNTRIFTFVNLLPNQSIMRVILVCSLVHVGGQVLYQGKTMVIVIKEDTSYGPLVQEWFMSLYPCHFTHSSSHTQYHSSFNQDLSKG